MNKISEILNEINKIAPFDTAADFDNVGLMVGSKEREIKKAIIALDITDKVISEAVNKNAALIISHHPVIFNPLKRVESTSAVYKLIENHIDAVACHTNLDKADKIGVNYTLAEKIGLENITEAGEFLLEGDIEPTTVFGFAEKLKEVTDCDFIEAVVPENIDGYVIETVGVSCGSGGEFVFETSCEAFVTGEMKHHERLYAKEKGIAAFILGHYKSEIIFKESLKDYLSEKFPNIEFIISKEEEDPSQYI